MKFSSFRSSPHVHLPNSVSRVMLNVVYALIPGIIVYIYFFGFALLLNIFITITTAFACETLMLFLRKRPILPFLLDGSALVTALLLALAIPPFVPWWIPFSGAIFAIIIAKHLYGGLGYNPFNPAMVGYAMLLISFPLHMTSWIPPISEQVKSAMPNYYQLNFVEQLSYSFTGSIPDGATHDSLTMATPLDDVKTKIGLNNTIEEMQKTSSYLFGKIGGFGWEWINLMFLLGGGWLLFKRVISWHIPVGLLAGLFVMAMISNSYDPDTFASPIFHLFSGATMLGAFFIATDPITAATTAKGRLYFGAGIGILIYIIRTWGGYPDGVAFAVLLMNMATPTIDYFTKPRVFGHQED